MPVIGFHSSHEQVHPSVLLAAVQQAEEVGFTAAMCSDHITPWSQAQGQSAFAWSWLGAALQSTGLPYGVVNAPGQRYHPAIIAQAIATLGAMYEGRFWVALGSGQNMNEHVTGAGWPRKEVRMARLRECVDVIRALLAGEEVTHEGLVTVDRARVFTLPATPPPLIAAAVTPVTARWAGEWGDGLITINQPPEVLREVVDGYRSAGGRGPLVLQVHLAYAASYEQALSLAHEQWRTNTAAPPVPWDLDTVEAFEAAAYAVRPEDVTRSVFVSADPGEHAAHLNGLADLGFDEIYLHHVGQTQTEFLDVFGAKVLPQLDVRPKPAALVA
ncbi:MAG: TIGR03885 family FMN-dependent LLM class oxidoreductase [Actinomycetes bacterium]